MDDLWRHIHVAVKWLDDANGRSETEVDRRLLKLMEEVGEVAQARIGQVGQNPRKGVTHDLGEVADELCDVVITAMVALATIRENPEEHVASYIARRSKRWEALLYD